VNLYRIASTKYANDLTGTGGLFGPGRWHREGTRILYTSEYVSLAKIEILANSKRLPDDQSLITLKIPDSASIMSLEPDQLSTDWRDVPCLPALADLSDQWLREGQFWIMRVPSAQSPTEYNYLLNPLHPEHRTLHISSIEPHPFDTRLK
jgi:RES domain-containing protein